jgi:hypothetical protein
MENIWTKEGGSNRRLEKIYKKERMWSRMDNIYYDIIQTLKSI